MRMTDKTWQLQEAKSRFSEVVDRALQDGPQIVTRRGVEVVVVLSYDEFARLKKPAVSLVEFFQSSPLVGVDLNLERDRSLARADVAL
jgi:prevent-host-death family protein